MHINANLTLYIIISSNLSNCDCQVSSLTQDYKINDSIILRNIFAGDKVEYCVILNVLNFLACSRHSGTCSGRQREVREQEKNKEEDRGRGGNTLTPTPPHHCFSCTVSSINENLEQAISFLNSSKTQWCTILRRVSVECIFYTVSEYASFIDYE